MSNSRQKFSTNRKKILCLKCADQKSKRDFPSKLLWKTYFQKFIFYFAKPIDEILENSRMMSHVILYKDNLKWDEEQENLKRYYKLDEIKPRMQILKDFHENNFQPAQPKLCTLNQNQILLKRNVNLYYLFYNAVHKTDQIIEKDENQQQSNLLNQNSKFIQDLGDSILKGQEVISFETEEHDIYQDNTVRSIKQQPLFRDLGVIQNLHEINNSQTGWDQNNRDFEQALDTFESKLSFRLQKLIKDQKQQTIIPRFIFKTLQTEQNQAQGAQDTFSWEKKPQTGQNQTRQTYKIRHSTYLTEQIKAPLLKIKADIPKAMKDIYLKTPLVKQQHSTFSNTSLKNQFNGDIASFTTSVVQGQSKNNNYRNTSVSALGINSTTAKTDRHSMVSPTDQIIIKIQKQQELNRAYGTKTKLFQKSHLIKDTTIDYPPYQVPGSLTSRVFIDNRTKTDHQNSLISINEFAKKGSDSHMLFNSNHKNKNPKVQTWFGKDKQLVEKLNMVKQPQSKKIKDHQIYQHEVQLD